LAVTSAENEPAFTFLFEVIKNMFEEGIAESCFEPTAVIADYADAINNAIESVFGEDVLRIHCWAHVIRNIDHKLSSIKYVTTRADVRANVLILQLANSEAKFKVASKLFMKKWRLVNEVTDFA
jgi:hypothetical protein